MHVIVVVGYLVAAAAFLGLVLLLASSWRGKRIGALLVLAAAVSALWSGFLAYAAWRQALAVSWLFLAEVLRYGAWLTFLSALFGALAMPGLLRKSRIVVHVLWVALALYCLLPSAFSLAGIAAPFLMSVPVLGILILALVALVLVEQVFRNAAREQRWGLKFLVLGLGVIFAYDIFLYSYAALYGRIDQNAWAARGFIEALVVPLLAVAAARNPQWSLPVAVSRRVVFYSSTLVATAVYIIATAIGGYYVRLYGGDWGRVAEITFVCVALLLLLLVALSGQARSRLRMFLHKNFFNFRHDYREEWLRLTAALSVGAGELTLRAAQAVARMMDSPAGALFLKSETDEFSLAAHWNLPWPAEVGIASQTAFFRFVCERQWIYDFSEAPHGEADVVAPPELCALPRVWLLVPLIIDDGLVGFAVLAQARARRKLDWEDIDLLRAAGRQVASTLVQAQSAERLAEARQFEGFNRLTAFMMHDLKNLVAQQSLLLKNAERHKRNPAFVDDMLATVENSVQRTSRLLEQLRGEAPVSKRVRVSLAKAIERAVAECGQQPPRPEFHPAEDNLSVEADGEQLAMVLAHLIRNAQEAVQPTGYVRVRLSRADTEAVIEIEDDGVGMSEEFIHHRLFKPFDTTKSSKGMGIGAYQAREYACSLGGRVSVKSEVGRGTVFTLFLPLALAAEIPVAERDLRVLS